MPLHAQTFNLRLLCASLFHFVANISASAVPACLELVGVATLPHGGYNMKALSLGLILAISTFSNAHAQRSPESLPAVTVDCYQSFAAKTQLPDLPSKEITINGGDFETPLIRYRLQVADKTTLKIIKDPNRPAFRAEHGKSVWEIPRDFTSKHQIVGWREELPGGIVRLFTFDFVDLLFSTIDISPARSSTAGVELHVMKCNKST